MAYEKSVQKKEKVDATKLKVGEKIKRYNLKERK